MLDVKKLENVRVIINRILAKGEHKCPLSETKHGPLS